jgi:arginyl-tRNA synthetase
MLRKYQDDEYADCHAMEFDGSLLTLPDERELIKQLARYGEVVERAGSAYDPSVVCSYLYDISKLFSRWYHDNPVLKASSRPLVRSRIELVSMVLQVIKNAFSLIGVPFLSSM